MNNVETTMTQNHCYTQVFLGDCLEQHENIKSGSVDLIKTFSNEGNLVVDLTMGSGSTGVACKNTNRNFIGIEKDEGYLKIAEQRINTQTLF